MSSPTFVILSHGTVLTSNKINGLLSAGIQNLDSRHIFGEEHQVPPEHFRR